MFDLFTSKEVTRYYQVVPLHELADMAAVISRLHDQFIANQGIRWGITLKGQNRLIGSIGFKQFTIGQKASLLYALHPGYWGNGYISEALPVVLQHGFDVLGVTRIDAEVMVGNMASERVLRNNGFAHEGLLRQWLLWDGKYYDINMFSIIAAGKF
jgi:ribosomal-protein-alanine N-acetyltransferase